MLITKKKMFIHKDKRAPRGKYVQCSFNEFEENRLLSRPINEICFPPSTFSQQEYASKHNHR